jgi:DNA mismatch repair ATPase MutS
MDEMWNSVTPKEGEAAIFGFTQELSANPNVMIAFATHFQKLKSLPHYTDHRFKNFKVVVNRLADRSIQNTYRLEDGASDQVIALDLLKQEGIAPEILDIAYKVRDQP